MSAEECFTALLKSVKQERYKPNDAEAAMLYHTLYSTYNPCAFLWGVSGACFGLLLGRKLPGLLHRCLGVAVGFAYAQECSWQLVDASPAQSFFRDLRGVQGRLHDIAKKLPMIDADGDGDDTTPPSSSSSSSPPVRSPSSRPAPADGATPVTTRVSGFLALDHVIGPTLSRQDERKAHVYSHHRGHAILWLLLFDFGWIQTHTLHPYLAWYWKSNAHRLRQSYSVAPNR
jgi:hypothetical protein